MYEHDDLEAAATDLGITLVPCGLNADWSSAAWCVTPGADPNRTDGAVYLIHDEDGDGGRYYVVRTFPSRQDTGEEEIEIISPSLPPSRAIGRAATALRADLIGPRYRHDCDRCRFLGRYAQPKRRNGEHVPEEAVTEVDLYWCLSPSTPTLDSVIARFGDDGPEYASSHPPECFADPIGYVRTCEPWYLRALERARVFGLYPRQN